MQSVLSGNNSKSTRHQILSTRTSSLYVHALDTTWTRLLSSSLLLHSLDQHLTHRPSILMYGKACQQKRSVGFFSNACIGYEYSGQKIKALAMLDWMNELIEYVNCKFGAEFNGILVNKYANGEEYMARHSDDECELDLAAGVVMISIGAVRTFRIRDKRTGAIRLNVLTHPGRMIQMSGEFQREFVHEIPVERKVSSARYSLTFRRHKARVF